MDTPTTHRRFLWGTVPFLLYALLFWAPGATADAAPVSAEKKAQAKAHYVKAKAAFEKDHYQQALFEYTKAYAALPLPGFLFNIGQCYRNMGYINEAIEAFELYLEKKPDAPNRAAVEELLKELNAKAGNTPAVDDGPNDGTGTPDDGAGTPDDGTADPAITDGDGTDDGTTPAYVDTTPPPKKEKKPTRTPVYKKWWFWTIVGAVAVGGGAAGVYFGTRNTGPDIPNSALGVVDFSQ